MDVSKLVRLSVGFSLSMIIQKRWFALWNECCFQRFYPRIGDNPHPLWESRILVPSGVCGAHFEPIGLRGGKPEFLSHGFGKMDRTLPFDYSTILNSYNHHFYSVNHHQASTNESFFIATLNTQRVLLGLVPFTGIWLVVTLWCFHVCSRLRGNVPVTQFWDWLVVWSQLVPSLKMGWINPAIQCDINAIPVVIGCYR